MLKKLFRHYDYSLLVTTLLLIGFGLIMVFSASEIYAIMKLQKSGDYIFIKQLVWCVVAVICGFIGMIIPYKMYKAIVKPITLVSILLLILVFVFGQAHGGAQSWIALGPFNIQPAEIVKLTVIIYLASVFSNKQAFISDFKTGVMPPLVMISILFLLVALQPDLGSAMIIAGIAGAIILCSGMRFKHLMSLLGLAASAILILFLFVMTNEQASRISSAYDPFSNMQGDGWQLINSYIAIASGGLIGKGLGQSIEKAGYLPEAHTDFIIAIIGEELGVLGILFVILCLGYLVFKAIVIAIRCKDVFGSLLAIGISSFVAIQTFVNLGVASGLMPLTGVTLPFISYGGSSLVIMTFTIGVLINISAFVNMRRKNQSTQEEMERVNTTN
ncbi:cell division-specific peptidoglycan biosynthesis regulator FtsW [Scopulibacillus darangshiensis]|uniref:Probable peptidoglycan glycosyltransferase FtsW n=1 Tax=Scopulibacillus darangshiensis TaxID=442528 RepID=A0A4R2P9G5_9BACL|nr:putative lipid II flippase FtsW [Scopulibacillus darangshiensis]TCP30505.1 cell division-specific peptidoglycan biosynthesis regulator FtsW [Scopulibacillus darangshiensis]